MQRKILSTEFDHVALLFKSDKIDDDLIVLDAAKGGVRLNRWSDYAPLVGPGEGQIFSQVCYRKVNF